MLMRRAPGRPQGVLQPLGQSHEALAAQDHMGMFEARPRKPEVIKHVGQGLIGDHHAEPGHVGEVGQPELSGLMDLTKDHFLLLPMKGAPAADPPFERAPDPR